MTPRDDATTLRGLAAQLARHLQDPGCWLTLATVLRDLGREPEAYSLIDEAPSRGLPLEVARRLRRALGGVAIAQAGRPFAVRSPDGARRRCRVSFAHDPAVLVPRDSDWAVFTPGASEPQAVLPRPPSSPACWLDGEQVLVARDREMACWTPGDGGGVLTPLAMEMPGPVLALSGSGESAPGWFFAELGRVEGPVRDVVVAHASSAAPRALMNLVTDLDAGAARWSEGVACCRGGVQSSEVRFVSAATGRWTLRTAHERATGFVMEGASGEVWSLDRGGVLLRWSSNQGRPRVSAMHTLPEGAQVPRRGAAALLEEGDSPWLLLVDHPRLRQTDEGGTLRGVHLAPSGHVWVIPGMVAPPVVVDAGGRLAVVGDSLGWYWLDVTRGVAPEAWRLPVALLTMEERDARPELPALRSGESFGNTLMLRARPPGDSVLEALEGAED